MHDLGMVALAWGGALWLRQNMALGGEAFNSTVLEFSVVVLLVQGGWFRYFGLYRGLWRFASIPDFIRIIKAVAVGALSIALVLFMVNRLEGIPRSIIPFYCMALLILLCMPRLFYRYWKDSLPGCQATSRALIVGAGRAGEMLVRDLLRETEPLYVPVGFVDDDRAKRRSEIHGIRVLGSCRKITRFVDELQIDIVLIAIPSARDYEMQRIVALCEAASVPFLTVPSLREANLEREVSGKTLRGVSIEDLLGRKPVVLAWEAMSQKLDSRCILVTGGGGSIGAELCKQIARFSISRLIIFERSEFALYQIELTLSQDFPEVEVIPLLGDVTDKDVVRHALHRYKPDMVFHAAAYKHVPLLEKQARQAVKNNVLGTYVLASECVAAGVGQLTLISSDKAVNPSNVMGATKRAAELLCQYFNARGKTRFITVRFGNVLDSAGSVVPLFREQIQRGGPVTVTHPEVTRYFMTIPEASQLILEASTVGSGGEIYVLDMGQPIKISYLAKQMILLSGAASQGNPLHIEYTGLRPGEKLHEELFHDQEQVKSTQHQKLMLAECRKCDYEQMICAFEKLQKACDSMDDRVVTNALRELVPEFTAGAKKQVSLTIVDDSINHLVKSG